MTAWLGRWRLLPELCHYDDAASVPAEATYEIREEGGMLSFHVQWTDRSGQPHEANFAAPPDGTRVSSGAQDVDTFAVLAESDKVLSGDAFLGARRVGYAVRRVSADGHLMTVLQQRDFPDGPQDSIFQVYRRDDG